MQQEPKLTDAIYEEIEKCEPYALLNLITFEMTIRNGEVRKIIEELDKVPSNVFLDFDSKAVKIKRKLEKEYLLDYFSYRDYQKNQQQTMTLHVSHNRNTSHTHHPTLSLYRPLALIPQQKSYIEIRIPIYHIHPRDIKNYYQKLMESHKAVLDDAKKYYKYAELFYDEVNKSKNKAKTYATMFFVWDYLQWVKETAYIKQNETKRGLYAMVGDIIGVEVNDTTGRGSTVEKYIETMNRLIEKCEYKKFYQQEI